MEEIVTEHSGSILRVQLNRPTKRNAMTSTMYLALASTSTRRRMTRTRVSPSGMAQEIPSAPVTTSKIS